MGVKNKERHLTTLVYTKKTIETNNFQECPWFDLEIQIDPIAFKLHSYCSFLFADNGYVRFIAVNAAEDEIFNIAVEKVGLKAINVRVHSSSLFKIIRKER